MRRGARTLVAASLVAALHLLAFLALVRLAPDQPRFAEGPIFEVVLAPPLAALRRRDAQSAAAAPAAPRPLRGPQDEDSDSAATAAVPFGPTPEAAPGTAPDAVAQAGRLRRALRQTFGCSQPDITRLNEAERDACLARFAAGAESAPYRPPLMDGDKQRGLDRAAARKAADRAYRESVSPPLGIDTTSGGPVMNPLPDL